MRCIVGNIRWVSFIRYSGIFTVWFIITALAVIPISAQVNVVKSDNFALTFESLLKADRDVTLTARMTGVIKKVKIKEGEHVAEGDTLLVIEDEEAQAEYNRAKANMEYAQKAFEWDHRLFDKEAITERKYLESKIRYAEAEASMKRAELQLKQTKIIAPFNGIAVIREQSIEVGQLLTINTPIFSVVKFEPLKTILYIPEQYFNHFHIGTTAKISSRYNKNIQAEAVVVEKSPVIDPASSTNKLILIMKRNPEKLVPGMQVIVTFANYE